MIIYVGASLDILHAGHINFFLRLKKMFPNCDIVVALNTDEFIQEFKGHPPVFNYQEREEHLLMCGYVDKVVPNTGGRDSKPAILQVHPDIVAVGTDWLEKDYCKQMDFDAKWLEEHNISLVYIPNLRVVSTTEIKRRLSAVDNHN
jgi:cytidyltransferase-like protein